MKGNAFNTPRIICVMKYRTQFGLSGFIENQSRGTTPNVGSHGVRRYGCYIPPKLKCITLGMFKIQIE